MNKGTLTIHGPNTSILNDTKVGDKLQFCSALDHEPLIIYLTEKRSSGPSSSIWELWGVTDSGETVKITTSTETLTGVYRST